MREGELPGFLSMLLVVVQQLDSRLYSSSNNLHRIKKESEGGCGGERERKEKRGHTLIQTKTHCIGTPTLHQVIVREGEVLTNITPLQRGPIHSSKHHWVSVWIQYLIRSKKQVINCNYQLQELGTSEACLVTYKELIF